MAPLSQQWFKEKDLITTPTWKARPPSELANNNLNTFWLKNTLLYVYMIKLLNNYVFYFR